MNGRPGHPSEGTERATDAVRRAAGVLARAGLSSPRVDAELLTAYVLEVPRARLALAGPLDADRRERLDALVAARSRGVPVQHLVGRAAFRRLELAVGPGAFIPRPETELLAGWAIALLGAGAGVAWTDERSEEGRRHVKGPGARASGASANITVDLCAGSGAIALAVGQEAPTATVYAVERDPAALRWLRRNAQERAAAGDRPVRVIEGDVTDPGLLDDPAALAGLRGRVDVVVCNPPYVPDAVAVPPEVADHDPPAAVFGGPDGLAVIAPVIRLAAALLRPGGAVGIEHDDCHGEAVPALLAADGSFTGVEDHRDLAGRPRFATARRRAHGETARGRLSP